MRVIVCILSDITLDGERFAPDDVVDLPEGQAGTLFIAGIADPNPAAVAHARDELGKPVRVLRPDDSPDIAAVYAEKAPKTPRRKKAAE